MADSTYDNFWNKVAPGMIDFGAGLYTKNQAQHEASDRLSAAQTPLYQQQTAAASGMLGQAGNFDPNTFAADRFQKQQAMLDPVYQKQQDDLMRSLYAKGQLGVATYNPGVAGITPNGTAMNPQMAALFAAQNAQRSKDAYASLNEGQNYLDAITKRAGMLSGNAAQTQQAGIQAQNMKPAQAPQTAQILRSASDILKNAGGLKALPGMIGGGLDWLRGTAKNFWNPTATPDAGMDFGDFSGIGNMDFGFGDPTKFSDFASSYDFA